MQTILQDLRYALRQLRRAPGFAFSVVLVLALGIGANAAMFTVLEATLFRPLPYAQPGDLVLLDGVTSQDMPVSTHLADLLVWRERSHTLDQIAYFTSNPAYLDTQNVEQKINAVQASPNLFITLGVLPRLGRTFTADEQQPGRNHVAVLSDLVWRNQFHADPTIVGQIVRLDDTPTTILGVMPAGFLFPASQNPAQLWQPVSLDPQTLTRTSESPAFEVIARARKGISLEAVHSEFDSIQKQLYPLYTDPFSAFIAPLHIGASNYQRSLTEKDQRTALLALLAAVAALWLIACANVACLMLARTASRRRELAVRAALGASRWRLTRQTLVESLLLSLTGCVVGLGLAQITLKLFSHSLTTQLNPYLSLHPDARVLAALLALSIVSALFFGVVPARLASHVNVEQALRQDGAQAGTGRHQHRLQRILVVTELSLTLALLVSCGLLLRTVFALRQVPLGFRTDHVFVLTPRLPDYKYDKQDKNALIYKPLLERLKTIPGVQAAAITTIAPLQKGFAMQMSLSLGQGPSNASKRVLTANMQATGPELQKVLGFGMARGRYFNPQDTPNTPLVAVVNSAFARLYEPASGDVSKFTMSMGEKGGPTPRSFKIVGVLDDLHQVGIANPAMPEIDINAAQLNPTDGFYQPTLSAHVELALRSTRDPKSLTPELRHVLQQFNPDLAATGIQTMDQIVDDAMGSQLLAAHLLEALGALALIVALAGLYSLLAYLVTLRTRELGLRLALGAQRADILSLILRGAALLLVTGIAIGLGLSLLTARLLHTFLFGVKQYDPVTLISAPILLLLVGALAAWLPARRASHLEPMQALRTE
jgi:predicted permease